MPAIPLHVRSGYSLCRGCVMPAALIERAGELGHRALALTDVNGLYGAPVFARAAAERGLRPIIGAELDDGKTSVVALVIDRTGYENLCQIITRLHAGEIVNGQLSIDNCSGLHLVTENEGLALALLGRGIPSNNLWFGIDPPTQSPSLIRRLVEAAARLNIELVATGRAMGLERADWETMRVLAAIRLGRTVSQVAAGELPHPAALLRSPEQLERASAAFPRALANNRRIVEECRFDLLDVEPVFPAYPSPGGLSPREHLRRLCEVGARKRYRGVTPGVTERLGRELDLIERKGFCEYFLVVRDIVRYARRRRAPTAARGSGGSSLVAYVLGIADVCPLALEIPFERFLNEQRDDFPDLDLDFCWRLRDEVIEFAFRRWGTDRVAMVSTHNTFQTRSAFRETAKAMGLSDAQISALERGGEIEPDRLRRIERLARRLAGLPHLLSVHPGGIVIGRRPIDHYVPIQTAAKGVRITQYDKDGVEAVGLVKLDLLGNRSLSTIREAINGKHEILISKSETNPKREARMTKTQSATSQARFLSLCHSDLVLVSDFDIRASDLTPVKCPASVSGGLPSCRRPVSLDAIPPDDPATFELLRRADTVGCNQLESPALRHLLRAMRPTNLRDIMQALALVRPGAAGVGMKESFIRRRLGLEEVPAGHGPVDGLLAGTYGVMLYEDDVMLVAAALLGASLDEGDRFRRAVQKCSDDAARQNKISREFLARCRANGVEAAYAGRLWVEMAKFNAYSFCRAHAASYARLAYAVAYLKAHHPLAFWTAALNNNQSMYHPRVYVEEAKRCGIPFRLPHVNHSATEYAIEEGGIRVGLTRIEGLGPVGVEGILAARRRWPFGGVSDLMDRSGISREECRALILCGALDGLAGGQEEEEKKGSRPQLMLELRLWRPSAARAAGGAALLAAAPTVAEALEDFSPRRKRLDQRRLLQLDVGPHALSDHRTALAGQVDADSRTLALRVGRRVRIAGMLEAVRDVAAKNGRRVSFLTFDDEWGLFEATALQDACRMEGTPTLDRVPAVIAGRVQDRYGTLIIASERISWLQ